MISATEIIMVVDGWKKVLEVTLLIKGRISQWEKENYIPRSWQMIFHLMNPAIPFPLERANVLGLNSIMAISCVCCSHVIAHCVAADMTCQRQQWRL